MTEGKRIPQALLGGATVTMKAVNQDAYQLVRNEGIPLTALIVADGLGSHYGAEFAAEFAVKNLGGRVAGASDANEIDLERWFCSAQKELAEWVADQSEELPVGLDLNNAFGTTLIAVVETETELIIAYLGNGAVLHVRGNVQEFLPPRHLLPWTAMNYLNPHSLPIGGKNVMYKLLTPRPSESEMVPTILRLRKDAEEFGDIVIVCTDGVYSYDQTPIGTDSNGAVWISGEATIPPLFDTLRSFFRGQDYTTTGLQTSLGGYLSYLDANNLVTDDCTVAVLITGKALQYQRSKNSQQEEAVQE